MSRKEQIEDRIAEMYELYLNGNDQIYNLLIGYNEVRNITMDYNEMYEYGYDKLNGSDWFLHDSFLVFHGSYNNDFLSTKVYIGLNIELSKEEYKEVLGKIIEFAVNNKKDIVEFKARMVPTNDCVVFRINSLEMLDRINDFIENSDVLNNDTLNYNPFIPRKENLMIIPDFEGGSYNKFVAKLLGDYFEECKKHNNKPTIETLLEFVSTRKYEQTADHFDNIFVDSLTSVSDLEILAKTLFVPLVNFNKIDSIFIDSDQYSDTEKFVKDKQELYSKIKKELGVPESLVFDKKFNSLFERNVWVLKFDKESYQK